jgi:fibronectin type 3 domain-containing protein
MKKFPRKTRHVFVALQAILLIAGLALAACDNPANNGNTYTVSFDRGEGTGAAPSSQTVASGTDINLPDKGSMTAPSGKAFNGWTAGGQNYAAGASYTVTGNVTFTARWSNTGDNNDNNNGDNNGSNNSDSNDNNGNNNGDNSNSNNNNSDSGTTTPGIPANVTAAAYSDTIALVTWNAVSGALGYRVYYETASSSGKILSTGGAWEGDTGYYVGDLAVSTAYTFYVTSMYWDYTANVPVESPYSASASARTMDEPPPLPDDPTNVEAVADSATAVTVTWSPAANAGRYEVSYWVDSYENREKETTTGASITITGLEPGFYYTFEVLAVNATGHSPGYYGVSAGCRTKIVPLTITAVPQPTNNSILVSWDDAAWIASCTLYYGSGIADNIKVDGNSYTHTGLSTGVTYYYYIEALDSHQGMERSGTVSALIVPTPTGLTTQGGSGISITISWAAVSGATEYKVEYQTDSSAEWTPIQETVTATGYNHKGLTEGVTYTYRIKALIDSNESAYSSTISRMAWPAPAEPTNVTATLLGINSISISWSAVPGANGYYVQKWSSNNGYASANSYTTTSCTDSNLSPGTYRYRVRAYNNYTSSDWVTSNNVTVSSPGGGGDDGGGGTTTPGTPGSVTATAQSSSSILVSWNTASGASGYRVYRSTSSSGSYSLQGSSSTSSYTDTGLSASTTYYYKVSAYNSAGDSSQSSYASATTSSSGGGGPSSTLLSNGVWAQATLTAGGDHYYHFSVTQGTEYMVMWNDSASGNGTQTGDIFVSAKYNSITGTSIFSEDDGWQYKAQYFYASTTGTVYLNAHGYTSGSYSIIFSEIE